MNSCFAPFWCAGGLLEYWTGALLLISVDSAEPDKSWINTSYFQVITKLAQLLKGIGFK